MIGFNLVMIVAPWQVCDDGGGGGGDDDDDDTITCDGSDNDDVADVIT